MRIKAQRYLESYGIKASMHRLAVMEYLMNQNTHPSADEIFSVLFPLIPTLSRTTIYNTLNMLAEQGAIQTIDINPRQLHYDYDTSPHAHFFCTACGEIVDIVLDLDKFHESASRLAPEGAIIDRIQLTYKGICKKCNNQIKYND